MDVAWIARKTSRAGENNHVLKASLPGLDQRGACDYLQAIYWQLCWAVLQSLTLLKVVLRSPRTSLKATFSCSRARVGSAALAQRSGKDTAPRLVPNEA